MVEIVILYILNKYDSTIYRLCKIIDEYFFAYLKSSAGTINPALKRLEKLECVTHLDKMSSGGMLSKTYSISKEGKKYLKELLLSFESKNPSHVVLECKLALFMSDILNKEELTEFKENLLNNIELHKIKLQKGLKNEYIDLSDKQKTIVETTLKDIDELIKLI